jgi:hypothetical protein
MELWVFHQYSLSLRDRSGLVVHWLGARCSVRWRRSIRCYEGDSLVMGRWLAGLIEDT